MLNRLSRRGFISRAGFGLAGLSLGVGLGRAAAKGDPEPTMVPFDPANFIDPTLSTSLYHPTRPGMQWLRAGTTEIGARKIPHSILTTMTDVMRTINGVPAVAMLDQSTDAGEISQVGFDYLAIDKTGNLWIMGGYTEDFEGGAFIDVENAWLGTSYGGVPGILVPAVVTMDTPRWLIGTPGADEQPSVAEPVEIGITTKVPFGEYSDVRAIREGAIHAIDNEIKYYAPGVGVILNVPKNDSLHQDYFELVNLLDLTPEGLAEQSQVVLDLEEHARQLGKEAYVDAPKAARRS